MPVNPGIWYGIGIGLVLLILSGLCPALVTPVFIATGLLTEARPEIPEIAGQPGWLVISIAAAVVLMVLLAVLVICLIILKRRYNRAMAAYHEKKDRYEQETLPGWESAIDRWNLLYFCLRDETVFLSGETTFIRLEELYKFLDNPNFRSL